MMLKQDFDSLIIQVVVDVVVEEIEKEKRFVSLPCSLTFRRHRHVVVVSYCYCFEFEQISFRLEDEEEFAEEVEEVLKSTTRT